MRQKGFIFVIYFYFMVKMTASGKIYFQRFLWLKQFANKGESFSKIGLGIVMWQSIHQNSWCCKQLARIWLYSTLIVLSVSERVFICPLNVLRKLTVTSLIGLNNTTSVDRITNIPMDSLDKFILFRIFCCCRFGSDAIASSPKPKMRTWNYYQKLQKNRGIQMK